MQGFALFRMPYASSCRLLTGTVSEFRSCTALNGRQGFVVAPFAPSTGEPILLISPDRLSDTADWAELQTLVGRIPCVADEDGNARADYHVDFANFHARLLAGDFQKLVLSRSLLVRRADEATPTDLFRRACDRYPRLFVCLVYTPQSGLWLTATPELLLGGCGREWETMALAGTMPFEEELRWSDKNIQEQRYVATYIIRQLERFTADFTESGPRTVRAGHLAHLRSDFHFRLDDHTQVGDVLHALHPTPAVCGLPKEEAFRFILHDEHRSRSYYSGFMGPLSVEGRTRIFVTLRCMQLFGNGYRLYAGGGLLTDSVEVQEWQETEAKLDTMRNLLRGER